MPSSCQLDDGFDLEGQLTKDPGAIEDPIAPRQGSGLALMLDLLAALLSGGKATQQITPLPEQETMVSQVFIAINPSSLNSTATASQVADQSSSTSSCLRIPAGERVPFPAIVF